MTYDKWNQTQQAIKIADELSDDGNYTIHLIAQLDEQVDKARLREAILATQKAHPLLQIEGLFSFKITDTELDLTVEHIIADGTAYGIIADSISAAYNGQPIQPEIISAEEQVNQEEAKRNSEVYEQEKKWYEQTFGAIESPSQIIKDVFSQKEKEWILKERILQIDKTQKLNSIPFTAAFALTLKAFSGDDLVNYATFFHGRSPELMHTVTMLVRTMPICHNFAELKTVKDLMNQTHDILRNLRTKDSVSFSEVCEMSGISADTSFIYQGDILVYNLHLDGRDYVLDCRSIHHPGMNVNVQIRKVNGEYVLRIEYPTHEYSSDIINQFASSYEHTLQQIIANPDAQLSDISVCNDQQIEQLDSFNNPATIDEWKDETIISLFRKIAQKYPDNIAAVFGNKQYTYSELDAETDRLANEYSKEYKPGSVISIEIGRDERMFLLPLAALKAGCIYQPIDPSYPEERKAFMRRDAQENTPAPGTFILLYTSGSTGVPKGVMLSHQNLLAYIHHYHKFCHIDSTSHIAAYASFGFDANMMDMYSPLLAGGTLYIIPEEIRLDMVALGEFFERNGITVAFMTTQVAQQFAQTYDHIGNLKMLSLGGEKMMSMEPPTGYQLNNIYGPTECSVAITFHEVDHNEPNIPIGKPSETTSLFVVDKNMHRLPVGAAGELLAVGPQVGLGYLGQPEKTAAAFIDFFPETSKGCSDLEKSSQPLRAYRTGDIVRYRENGDIEFVGRKDGQVKIRGFRIELKEVEAVIREFSDITDCTVQAFDDQNGGKYIAAYIVSNKTIDIEQLNAFIMDQKPPYMVPAVTMQIEKIPLNVNQKVDKKALPKPENAGGKKSNTECAAPLNSLEKELHDIIASVIKTDDFGITDILGYLGLTSISSIKLATLIFKKYGIQVNSKALAKNYNLQSIENEILTVWMNGGGIEQKKESSEEASANKDAENDFYPLTYPQMGVYLDCLKNPGTTLYNVPTMISFPNCVSASEVSEAVKATIENHQSFKLVFKNNGGEPQQILIKDMPIDIPIHELEEADLPQFEEGFMRPFNLSEGPLFRFEIVSLPSIREKADKCSLYLFIDIHHLITDGGSVDIIIKEINSRLNGEDTEKEDYSYLQFASDQHAAEGGKEYNEAQKFFEEHLHTCEGASEITADKPKDDTAIHSLGISSCRVNLNSVEQMAKTMGVTPMSIFLSATYYTISRFVNSKQIYIGTISSGRSNLRTYNTTGMFVNTLALHSEIGEQSVKNYIEETSRDFSQTIEHEQYPFARIAADYGFQPKIVFEYQVGVMADYQVRGEKVNSKILSLDLAKFNIKIAIQETTDGGCEIKVGYDEALYTPQLASSLAECIGAVVNHFVNTPDALVKTISIMSERQSQEVEKMHNISTAEVPYKRFYEPIEMWAKRDPERKAVIACDRTLTYGEFNKECNHVAYALMERGVKRGDRIILLLPRDSRMMCCIFGVSKTGAAYIPCDPAYPAERIKLILEDSEATYVITTSDHMAEHEGKAINVDELLTQPIKGNTEINPCVSVEPSDLVYLIYTSGSTGRPKGVMLRHESICNYLYDHPANRHIHSLVEDKVNAYVCITTFSFDMSLKEYGGALHNGITAVIANEDEVNNPILLTKLFERTGAEVINGTPSRILNLMELPEFCNVLSKCKSVWSGGEKYSDTLLQRLQKMGVRIFNTYGPTEITVSSNVAELTHQTTVCIGRPLLNYTEFVVDCDGNELPVGVVGELYIGGIGVASGYNNLPKQTQERFIKYRGLNVYKSGDYARWMPDGQVDVLGRLDNQVKLNGLRIELGEVEAAISRVEGIKQAVVKICNISGRDHLAAYFTAVRQMNIEELKNEIGTTLTHYMVPTAYLQMEAFPLTPNGKTDLKNLPEPLLAQVGGEWVAPRNQAEKDFCEIFQKILNMDKVSAADSFFELGGTSLTVTRVIIEAATKGYNIAYADVFKYSTAQQLAQLVGGEEQTNNSSIAKDAEVTDYDYSKINELLSRNTLDSFIHGEPLQLGDVILTGASGYLGIHILHELLENYDNKVFCLVRHGRDGVSSETRLKNLLFYYFEKSYTNLLGKRLFVIDGDVTDAKAFDEVEKMVATESSNSSVPLTLINCAAIVKHFSDGTEIEDINIGGLQACVDFCLRTNTRLIQTSTNSTGGTIEGDAGNYSEQVHYFGQTLTGSKYIHSKFLAERITLESIIEKGLIGKVVRLGNLSARALDGEFQINFRTNSAMGRLHIYQMLGQCSYTQMAGQMEFSPIDEVARAILLLATAPRECVIFHPFNNHMVQVGDVVQEMAKTLGTDIRFVEDEEFEKAIAEAGKDPEKAKILQSMLAYRGMSQGHNLPKYNPYTIQVLARLGFHWNVTSWDYVQRFVEAIAALEFFNDKR